MTDLKSASANVFELALGSYPLTLEGAKKLYGDTASKSDLEKVYKMLDKAYLTPSEINQCFVEQNKASSCLAQPECFNRIMKHSNDIAGEIKAESSEAFANFTNFETSKDVYKIQQDLRGKNPNIDLSKDPMAKALYDAYDIKHPQEGKASGAQAAVSERDLSNFNAPQVASVSQASSNIRGA